MTDLYRFGIEEEYFLADARTGRSPSEATAERFHDAVEAKIPAASRELLIGQVETQTPPETNFDSALNDLHALRRDLADLAESCELSLIAAGSQPLAIEEDQLITRKSRYKRLASKVGAMAERVMVCAMHVHVELPDPDRRIDVMNRMVPFMPLFLALSVSSPFWEGGNTGLRGFRLAAFAEWPHMGLPVRFDSTPDYERFVEILVKARVIPDASFIWWLIRPCGRYPTLELRICDSCTRVDETVAIAALYRCLVCALDRRPEINANVGAIHWGVTAENVWQVQHLGIDAKLIDAAGGGSFSIQDSLESAIALVGEEAETLSATAWLDRCRSILDRGTSADRQLATFKAAEANGVGTEDALRSVVRALAAETLV